MTGPFQNLKLTNIGNGIALNVTIDRVNYTTPEIEGTYLEFDPIPMIQKGEPVTVKCKDLLAGVLQKKEGLSPLDPDFAYSTVVLRMTFENLDGERYEQKFQMGKEGSRHISLKKI